MSKKNVHDAKEAENHAKEAAQKTWKRANIRKLPTTMKVLDLQINKKQQRISNGFAAVFIVIFKENAIALERYF